MTDSPINLDEAYRSIDSGRHKQIRSVETGKWEVLIEGSYLESIVSELVAARERITELEGKIETVHKAQLQEVIDNNHAIIPQAGDADSLHFMLDYLGDDPNDNRDPEIEIAKKVLHRYLTAIEGGKL